MVRAYELTEGRSKPLEYGEARALLDKHCQQAKQRSPIYRGISGQSAGVLYFEPKQTLRPAANTSNFVNLLVDNLPSWSAYPKRGKSIICSADRDIAEGYGQGYQVFPFDGVKIGVCGDTDFWGGFEEQTGLDVPGLNDIFHKLKVMLNQSVSQDDFQTLIRQIRQASKMYHGPQSGLYKFPFADRYAGPKQNKLFDELLSASDPVAYLNQLLDPNANGFQLMDTSNFHAEVSEVWLEGPAVLVKMDADTDYAMQDVD